jgi:hypothetical protein
MWGTGRDRHHEERLMADHYGDAPRWSKVALLIAALVAALLMAYTLPSVVVALYFLWGM